MKKIRCCLLTILFMVAAGPVLAQTNTLPVGLTGSATAKPGAITRAAPLAETAVFDNTANAPAEEYYDAYFYLEIEHVTTGTNDYYIMSPQVYTYPESFNEVASPNGLSHGGGYGFLPYNYATFQEMIEEIGSGDWFLILHGEESIDFYYYFTIDASALSANDLPPTVILHPLDGATGVATNTTFQWTGPTSFTSLYVYDYDNGSNNTVDSSSLPVMQTSWTYGGPLPVGTNTFTASYSINYTGLVISDLSAGSYPIFWSTIVNLSSRGYSKFVAAAGYVPLPVALLPPVLDGNGFGLSFVSQSGATHTVQCTTNLVVGPWLPVTNFTGTGGLELITLPNTNSAAFYRVKTQ